MSNVNSILSCVEPLVTDRGFSLYDLDFAGGVLRVTVQESEGGSPPNLDDISSITRSISAALDTADLIQKSYTLEVSTPGLERNLRTAAHYAGAVGEKVKIKLFEPLDGARRLSGVLSAALDETIVLIPDASEDPIDLQIAQIDKARTTWEWVVGAKPGGPGAKRSDKNRRSSS